MSYCLVPGCFHPQNPNTNRICQSCGTKLLLKERYRAVLPLGRGGFGRTFLAIDEDIPSKPQCVIKQLYLTDASRSLYNKAVLLFQQEAVRLDELGKHPQIPSLLAHFEQNRLLYLVQEWIDGQTLAEEVAQQGALNELQIWELLRDLLPTLKFIHDRQVIHRDLKPANIMRRQQDKKLVLIDFGIAKVVSEMTLAQTGTVIGSPEYMAPEQTRGKAVPASDLYSLGVVCIRLLTDVSPFDLFDVSSHRWAWRDALPPGKRVSKRLGDILDKLLHSALNDRYPSADAVLQDLDTRTQTTTPAPGTTVHPPTADPAADLVPDRDYRELEHLLATKQWELADRTTWNLIRQGLNKPLNSYVFCGELQLLSCAVLQRIDRLWHRYSRGRFGFSVQVRIYRAVDEDYGAFCDRVGWQQHNRNDRSQNCCFQSGAPVGHLPSRLYLGGQQWWRHMTVMKEKLDQCGGL